MILHQREGWIEIEWQPGDYCRMQKPDGFEKLDRYDYRLKIDYTRIYRVVDVTRRLPKLELDYFGFVQVRVKCEDADYYGGWPTTDSYHLKPLNKIKIAKPKVKRGLSAKPRELEIDG